MRREKVFNISTNFADINEYVYNGQDNMFFRITTDFSLHKLPNQKFEPVTSYINYKTVTPRCREKGTKRCF